MNYVYTHLRKSNVNGIVEEYVEFVKTYYLKEIRFLRLDGERTLGIEFSNLMKRYRINVERTALYTPDQNGHAERSGGMIITVARAIRIYAKLPKNL